MNTASTIEPGEDNWLLDEESESGTAALELSPWRVLIVDDEPDIHAATRLALGKVMYKGRGLQMISAYSAREGIMAMRREADIALVLLDVVMESDDAGLRMARQIRDELGNALSRIVLRTGQPGQAPESDVILQYDINDYKCKTDLSHQKLFTTVIASLRTYESLVMIERNRRGLERILDASTDLYHVRSLREFASGVLNQVSAILDVGADGVLCLRRADASDLREEGVSADPQQPLVMAATGSYAGLTDLTALGAQDPVSVATQRAFQERRSRFEHPLDVLHVQTPEGHEFVILVSPPWPLAEPQRQLLELFCSKIAWAFDNLHQFEQLQLAQQRFTSAVAELFEALQARQKAGLAAPLGLVLPHLSAQSGRSFDGPSLLNRLEGCVD